MSHFVPRTVAALYFPAVRNAPFPSPQRRRFRGFFAAAVALCAFGHAASASTSLSVVMPRDCDGGAGSPSSLGMEVDELFDAWERAWSGRDPRGFEPVCAADVHYEDPLTPEPLVGVRAL